MQKSVLVCLIVVTCVAVLTQACKDNSECTTKCTDNYHEQCDKATAECYCVQARPCRQDTDCCSGGAVGCPPGQAKCQTGNCMCMR